MYCYICGCPLSEQDQTPKWVQQLSIVSNFAGSSDPEIEAVELGDPELEISMYQAARYCGDQHFEMFENGQVVSRTLADTSKPRLYFPIHTACSGLVDRLLTVRARCEGTSDDSKPSVTSLQRLWMVFMLRCGNVLDSGVIRVPATPDGRFYGAENYQHKDWDGYGDSNADVFIADPLEPAPTKAILAHLQALTNTSPTTNLDNACATNILALPQEIQGLIIEKLHSLHDPPLSCTRILSPRQWRLALLNSAVLPWLWDLDTTTVGSYKTDAWDWELLVRMLAQTAIFEPGNAMEDIPLGLRNRRRIWRLLEEMRVGDSELPPWAK